MKADVTFHFEVGEYEEWAKQLFDQEKALDAINSIGDKMRNYTKHQVENSFSKALIDGGFTQEQTNTAHDAMHKFIQNIKTFHGLDN